ncbi:hypothetical protein K435DRAFT_839203 [Dendrothele bispora CBS 962.96]|uniref:Uncharacterized protein n=1 Tax=Dendrothele bispora (strain CBS 962.96) TaxID=1314807 RepID=A0A4S8M355_DENBC|nr:hypothetical protein K435DRAFT_839203 [Dendrothele bispora CBS 962.96]
MARTRKLFTPPEGRTRYKSGDRQILCQSAPIPFWEIPPYLLKHPAIPGFHAPWLWCGWYGEKFLFKVFQEHFPTEVIYDYCGRPDELATLLKLPRLLMKKFDIPEMHRSRILVTDVATPNGWVDTGFAIGSNYQGVLPHSSGELLDKITQEFFGGKEAEWILDNRLWRWTPQKRAKSSDSDSEELDYYEPPSNPQEPFSEEYIDHLFAQTKDRGVDD